MPLAIPNSSVNVGSASHETQAAHHSQDHANFGVVHFYPEHLLSRRTFQEEVVCEPSQRGEHWARNGGNPENDELWVVACTRADECLGDGWFVTEIDSNHIDYCERGSEEAATSLEENSRWKFSLNH